MDINIINRLSEATGLDAKEAFSRLTDFIIGFFDPEKKPLPNWNFTEEANNIFQEATRSLFLDYQHGITAHGWTDPLGTTFEEVLGRHDASRKGQFFTPPTICELMAEITVSGLNASAKHPCGAFGNRHIAADPTCGSGRNLLAVAAKFDGRPRSELPYFVGEDIDPLCCKMCAINLMMHGVPGEVVCHNTLAAPHSLSFGFVINEAMFPMPSGLPSIRRFTDPLRFVSLR